MAAIAPHVPHRNRQFSQPRLAHLASLVKWHHAHMPTTSTSNLIETPTLNFNLSECQRIEYGDIAAHLIPLVPNQAIELACGITVKIAELHQTYTYAGMLCGAPSAYHMARDIHRTLGKAHQQYPDLPDDKTFVIPPVISAGIHVINVPHLNRIFRTPWEKMPDVTTIALLSNECDGRQCIAAVWWQDAMGYPPPAIIDQIKLIDWDAQCSTGDL